MPVQDITAGAENQQVRVSIDFYSWGYWIQDICLCTFHVVNFK